MGYLKKIQYMIGLPSALILMISLLVSYEPVTIIALIGCFIALVCRQIRYHRYSYRLGHPDRHSDELGYDLTDDHLDEAETYDRDRQKR
ncbi:hypothetical protein [Alkalihalobacillus sp. CinArs1]|uniref:hypothetical protein n=1 Tax=Alkalihalobacillus sp. CinArs1 TaxID=2995314 RepID=UPI0022DE8D21|nr:hypothetical protein [Alkalihalobacillus sp. CinArs1]